jgi:hypothetical protein
MSDFYDGPRGGIADYHGHPHVYDSLWSDLAGEWTDLFLLMPIDATTFQLAIEDWLIWERWQQAFRDGRATQESHPALPEERFRHDEIIRLLGDRLRVIPELAFTVAGRFDYQTKTNPEGNTFRQQVVYWSPVSNIPDDTTQSSSMLSNSSS